MGTSVKISEREVQLPSNILNNPYFHAEERHTTNCDVQFMDIGVADNVLIPARYSFLCKDYMNNVILNRRNPMIKATSQVRNYCSLHPSHKTRALFLLGSTKIKWMVPIILDLLNPMMREAGLREIQIHNTKHKLWKLIEADLVFARDNILMNMLLMLMRSTFYCTDMKYTSFEDYIMQMKQKSNADGIYLSTINEIVRPTFYQEFLNIAKKFCITPSELAVCLKDWNTNLHTAHSVGIQEFVQFMQRYAQTGSTNVRGYSAGHTFLLLCSSRMKLIQELYNNTKRV